MEAKITLRTGVSDDDAKFIRDHAPMTEYRPVLGDGGPGYQLGRSMYWVGREQAASVLDVGIRTIDRYIRRRLLTGYRGPVPEGGKGMRVWADDVARWAELHPVLMERAE